MGIKNKNNISYIFNNTKHKLTILNNKILLVRENDEFIHKVSFELNKKNKTEYYIKEYNTNIDLIITTTKIIIANYTVEIYYTVIDNLNEYHYFIEMSDKI